MGLLMDPSENQFELYHGTRSSLGDRLVTGPAWATNDPEQAAMYGKTKLPLGVNPKAPVKIYRVSAIKPDNVIQQDGTKKGEMHFESPHGFTVDAVHDFRKVD
jgi:hypothetical protein